MVCFETAEAEMIVEDVQPITSWADSIDDEDEYFYNVSRAPIPSWAVMDVTFEAAEDPEPSPSGPVRAEIPVVQKRVIRDGWRSRVVLKKTSVMPPVTTDSAGHPSKLERQKEKSESLVPPAPASVPKTAPRDAVDTPKVSKKPRRRKRKIANAPSQSEEINGQETSTEPITPDSPPQQESSAQRLDEPDQVKSESLIPPADAADPKAAPRDAVDTPKVSKKPRRRKRKMANASSQNQGIGGQETSTAPSFTPPSPPQKKSTSKTLKSRVPPAPAAALKTAAVVQKRVIRDGWKSRVVWQKTSVMPPVTTDSAGHPSKLERQKEKSESLVPPAPASVPKTAPRDAVDTPKVSSEPRRRIRKVSKDITHWMKRCVMCIVGFLTKSGDWWTRDVHSTLLHATFSTLKSTSKTLKSRVPPAPAAALKTAVNKKRVIRDGWRSWVIWQKTSVMPPVTTDSAGHPSKLERQKEKSESVVPPAPASVPRAAPSQSEEINGQETSTEPIMPDSPPQQESSAQRLDEPDQVKSESLIPPADAADPKAAPRDAVDTPKVSKKPRRRKRKIAKAPSQSEEINGQETSTEPIMPNSPPQQESSAQRLDEPDPVKSESLIPPADAAVPKAAPRDAVDTPKVSKKPRRRKRKIANASSQNQGIGGQDTSRGPSFTPPSPPQKESTKTLKSRVPPAPAAALKTAAVVQKRVIRDGWRSRVVWQKTSVMPPVTTDSAGHPSKLERQKEKSESLVPPAPASVPKTAPRDAVDTPKVSKKPRRRKRKVSKAPSQSEEINGQETSTEPIMPDSPPQQESSAQRLDEPDQVKSESLIPPADAADPKTAPRDAVDTPKVSKKPRRRKRKVANDITHWMKRCVMCIVGFLTKSGDWWTRDVHSTLLHATFSTLKSTSKALKSRVPPAPAAALKTAAVVQKRVIRDGWRSWVIWQKTSVMPPVTTDSAGHPSKLERQKEKSESLVPPAPASVPKTAPSQRQETGGQETATKPVVTPASPSEGQRSAWGTSLPQLQRPRDKPETLVPPAPADVPRAAPSQSEEINGQETSTEPITPDSPPQQESSAQRLDEPDQVKSESLIPQADAADPKAAPRDAVDTPKVSKKPRRRKRKMANASSQNQGIGGQETFTAPSFTPPSPPQKESTKTLKSRVPPAPAAALKTAPSQSEEINGQETSTEPITPDSPPQQESSAQRLDEPDPVKSESLIPPADAADPKAAPRDAVDTPKVSKKPRRRKRKVANASSQNQGIGGQETSRGPSFTPPSPPQNESSMRLDKPDPVKSEPLVPPADGALPKTVLRKQEIAGEETQRQEASDTGTSVVDLCERLEKVHQSSKPPARATQAPEPESNRK
ncbi:proline-rich protein 36-like isoform X5 [Triplophysa dalaica]|uniref:proline-rich protein 36-like isoform X5 n=1 Tax=Triplophysa dalaica TaxID=1582913 RepID=UPI0024DFCE41|nr:proline-rich protein 36-like isoform X5 [Triplophysa dalaica]